MTQPGMPEPAPSRVSLARRRPRAWHHHRVSATFPGARRGFTGRAAVLALVLAALAVMLAVPARSWMAQRAEIAGLEEQVAEATARVASLQVEAERWKDPAFIAAEARRRLHFVMPGEIGYVTLGADGAPVTTASVTPGPEPWSTRLWASLRAADSPPVVRLQP